MKFLALIYRDEARWHSLSETEREQTRQAYRDFARSHGGKVVDGQEVSPTNAATTVRVRAGEIEISDGPFEELPQPIGGFFVFECETADEAAELATRLPGARTGTVEVRPQYGGEAS